MIDDPHPLPEAQPLEPSAVPQQPVSGPAKSPAREWLETIVWALAIALVLRFFVIQAFTIPSGSMEDTLLVGDFLLAEKITKHFHDPVPGDIVIFQHPNPQDGVKRDLIKRCVATAGMTVEVRNKDLYINGVLKPIPTEGKHIDPNTYPATSNRRDNFGPVTVPPGNLFVMGDNRDNSDDSSFWGFMPLTHLKARPMILYWSWNPDPGAPPLSWNPMSWMFSLGYNITHFFQRVRWARIGHVIR